MTDDLVNKLRAIDHLSVEDCFCQSALYAQAADRIEALTAERDYTEGTNDTLIALNQSLTADNARLREAAAEVLRISDRDHVAWHRLRAEITKSRGVKPVSEKKWMASYLTVGDEITNHINGAEICVSKIDRRDDPFFASVIRDKIVEATGLFPTLSAARKWCEARAALTGKADK